MPNFRVVHAGQDITAHILDSSIQIQDQLGQGPGVAAGSSGRAATLNVLTNLGPAANALGAGSPLPTQQNLLTSNQSSFQSTSNGIWPFSADVSAQIDVTQSWTGRGSCLEVHYNGIFTFQTVEISIPASTFTPGQTYTFSCYIKANKAGSLRFYCQGENPAGNIGSVGSINVNRTWQRYSFQVTMPNPITPDHCNLRLDTGSTAQNLYIWVDGLQVEQGNLTNWHLGGTLLPKLVREGSIYVYDTAGNVIYGGLVTMLDDKDKLTDSGLTQLWTNIEAHDWWQDIDRVNVVNETFDGQTDLYIINYLCQKYYPAINRSMLPTVGGQQLGPINLKNKSLQKCLQFIADKVGNAIWIDPTLHIHYSAPGQFGTAPFALSQYPDFQTFFQMGFDEYTVDDSSAINRVTFYGGKHLSNDFYQDLSVQANGSNTTFTLAYYPHKAHDGFFHVYVGGSQIVVGFYGSAGAANTLKSAGGLADVLINTDAHTLIFNVAPSNTGPNSVQCQYRYETPLVVQVVDQHSVSFYGRYLDGTISDETVFDTATAVQRCRILLNEQSLGLTTLKVRCWKPGLQSGMLLTVIHPTRGIADNFLIQEVDVKSLGGGNFEYSITAGAWHWNIVDFVMSSAQAAAAADQTTNETTTVADVRQDSENLAVSDAWSKQTRTASNYLLRNTPVGDGRDLYFGLASL